MTPNGHDLGDVDLTVPNVARMWDYYLGGSNNFDADREAARLVLGAAPDVPLAALENREFLKHAVRFLVEDAGISQFIDIGPGLPTQGNIHQLAQKHDPSSRVVYVDNDPAVLAQGHPHVAHIPGVSLIEGDLRYPDEILNDQDLRNLIDLAEPVALCMTLVLHFVPDQDDPFAIVARLRDALCPGSYLVISHVTRENRDHNTLRQITETYDQATLPLVMRTRDEIGRFFEGFTLIEPGLVFLSQWRPSTEYYAGGGTRWAYAGVGRKGTGNST
jgi:S-adenosyl methyltransferase